MRKTLIQLAAPAMFGPGGDVATVKLSAVKQAGDVAFTAELSGTPGVFKVSDDAGKVRTFRDADEFFKQAGALSMVPEALTVNFDGLSLVAPRPFTGDIVRKAQATVAGYAKRKADALARVSRLDQEIALMASDPTVPQARKDEANTQKASVQGLADYLTDEIARINAILTPTP